MELVSWSVGLYIFHKSYGALSETETLKNIERSSSFRLSEEHFLITKESFNCQTQLEFLGTRDVLEVFQLCCKGKPEGEKAFFASL